MDVYRRVPAGAPEIVPGGKKCELSELSELSYGVTTTDWDSDHDGPYRITARWSWARTLKPSFWYR
jgi:hypothetical protein